MSAVSVGWAEKSRSSGLTGQLVCQSVSGSLKDPVSKNKVEYDKGCHSFFSVAMIPCQKHYREEGFLLARRSRGIETNMVGKTWHQEGNPR